MPILPKHMERDPEKLKLLERWKGTLRERHTVAVYKDSTDLAVQVAADLSRTISELADAARTREVARLEATTSLSDEVASMIDQAIKAGVVEAVLLSGLRRTVSNLVAEAQHVPVTVFLSYANADRDIVRRFAAGLSNAGIRVWFDEFNLRPGSRWVEEIERGLDTADFVAFFISSASVGRGFAQRELQIALHRQVSGERGATILPVLLEHAEVPPLLRDIQWLDVTDHDVDKGVERLVEVIRHHALSRRSSEDNVA